jgi:hypothetical protein
MLRNLPVPHIERFHTSIFIVNSPFLVIKISNKTGFTSFGVSLQKFLQFFCLPGSTASATNCTTFAKLRLRLIAGLGSAFALPLHSRSGSIAATIRPVPVMMFLLSIYGFYRYWTRGTIVDVFLLLCFVDRYYRFPRQYYHPILLMHGFCAAF